MIEAVIALLIFSAGVLGIARLQSVAVQQTSTAGFRSTASLQAKNLIATMWLSDRTAATLKTNFDSRVSPQGAGYTAWLSAVTSSGLPGVSATTNPPSVWVTPVAGGGTTPVSSANAVVTVYWTTPGDSVVHKYVETAQIK